MQTHTLWTISALMQTIVIIYKNILCINFNVFSNPSVFMYALLVFRNSLKIMKIDRSISDYDKLSVNIIILTLVYLHVKIFKFIVL